MLNRETGTFKKTYGEDLAIYRTPLPKITIAAILVLVFVIVPFIGTEYWLGILNLIGIAALGLNILVGYSGQISVGHAAFMSVGAYTAAVLLREFPDRLLLRIGWWRESSSANQDIQHDGQHGDKNSP